MEDSINSEVETSQPTIAELTLEEVDYLVGDQETPTRAQCLLKQVIDENGEGDSFEKKLQVWEAFRGRLEDHEHRHLHLAEIIGSWFYKNFGPIRHKLDVIKHAEARKAKGELPQRELGIGDKVAITIAGWPEFHCPVDYVGYPATFEDCVAVAIKRIPEIKAEAKFDWAIVLGAEIVGITQRGEYHLAISDPKEYYLDRIEPSRFFEGNQTDENSGLPLNGVVGLDPRHSVATLLLYPNKHARRIWRDFYGY
jgi:hypothetical protein